MTHIGTAAGTRDEREEVRGWVLKSLLKRGIWGSGLDTLLTALREALRAHAATKFPSSELEAVMLGKGKSLRFDTDEVRDVLESMYGEQRAFVTLALLFPHVDLRNVFHVDHVFPRAQMRKDRLRKAGVPEDQLDEFVTHLDQLPNLQLLAGPENIQKKDTLPAKWLESAFPDVKTREQYCVTNELGSIPPTVKDFLQFFEGRRARLEARLSALLGVSAAQAPKSTPPPSPGPTKKSPAMTRPKTTRTMTVQAPQTARAIRHS